MHNGVVVVALLSLAGQSPEDLGVGAPLSGPSPADLGVDDSATAAGGVDDGSTVGDSDQGEGGRGRSVPGATAAEKAARLRADVDAALADLDPDHRGQQQRLDAVAGLRVPEAAYALDPPLKALHRIARVRALALAGRVDDAGQAMREVGRALDAALPMLDAPAARRLRAAARFAAAFVDEARARAELARPLCGQSLGLRRLAQDEARARRRLLDGVAAAYAPVARGADRYWARRAAYQVTTLYEEIARRSDQPADLRTATLPAPYAIDAVDTGALLQPALDSWVGELRRSYAEIGAAVDARDPDDELSARARQRAEALARFTPDDTPLLRGERVENPWLAALHEGLVRVAERPERRNAQGRFVPVPTRAAIDAMTRALATPGSVDHAYALAGLARLAADRLPDDVLLAALVHVDERVVVAGLIAVVDVVAADGGATRAANLREAVVAAFAAAADDDKRAPFVTAQKALFGRAERALLALSAVARADREGAEALLRDERLPVVERAWLAAELADPRFAGQYDQWAWDKDERVAALATWGGHVARRRHAGYLLRPQADGLVGCASRAAAAQTSTLPSSSPPSSPSPVADRDGE